MASIISGLLECSGIHPAVHGRTGAAHSDEVVRVLALAELVDLGDLCLATLAGLRAGGVGTGVVHRALVVHGVAHLRRPRCRRLRIRLCRSCLLSCDVALVHPAVNIGAAAADCDQVDRMLPGGIERGHFRLAGLASGAARCVRVRVVLAAGEGDDVADLQRISRSGCGSGVCAAGAGVGTGALAAGRGVVDEADEGVAGAGSPVAAAFLSGLSPERRGGSPAALGRHDLGVADDLLDDRDVACSVGARQSGALPPNSAGAQLRSLTDFELGVLVLDEVLGVDGLQILAAAVAADLIEAADRVAHAVREDVAVLVGGASLDGGRPAAARFADVVFVAGLRFGGSWCEHFPFLLSGVGFCGKLIEELLPVCRAGLLDARPLVRRALVLQEHRVRRLPDRLGVLQSGQDGAVALAELLPEEAELRLQISDRGLAASRVVQELLLP